MPKLAKDATIGIKVRREELPTIHKLAKRLGYKNLHKWVQAMFYREYTKALADIVGGESEQKQSEIRNG